MQITHQAMSGYRIRMQKCLQTWAGQGNSTITQEELASCMDVKITASFRRHISELQTDKQVTRFTYPTEKGGYKVAYLLTLS